MSAPTNERFVSAIGSHGGCGLLRTCVSRVVDLIGVRISYLGGSVFVREESDSFGWLVFFFVCVRWLGINERFCGSEGRWLEMMFGTFYGECE